MKKIVVLISLVTVLLVCITTASAAEGKSLAALLGELRHSYTHNEGNSDEDGIVAIYKDNIVTTTDVEYYRALIPNIYGDTELPSLKDKSVIDYILNEKILVEEATQRGLTVTEEEIDAFLNYCVFDYYNTTDGKQFYDDYCTAAGMSFEEYASQLREQTPSILLKSKLKDSIAKNYCIENSLDYDEMNYPQDAHDMLDQELNDIFDSHKGEIQYFYEETIH